MQNPSAPERLRVAGLRVTKPRVAVLEVLDSAHAEHRHLTAATIADRVRPQLGTVSVQAVYDCLAALTRVGLLRTIEPAGHPVRYETSVGDEHHHLVCRTCGHIADVGALAPDACLSVPTDPEFRVETTEVTFWGLCPSCAARTPALDRH